MPRRKKGELPPISEAEFQAQVLQLAGHYGWEWYHPHDSRHSPDGFPDLVIVRVMGNRRVIWAELKKEGEKPTPKQEHWLEILRAAGCEVYLWKPSDFEQVVEVLSR